MQAVSEAPPAGTTPIILRYAPELALKAPKTRARFQHALHGTIRAALAADGCTAHLARRGGRLFVETDRPDRALARLDKVFGVASLSPVVATASATLEEIAASGAAAFAETVHGRSFAVRARRFGRHDFRSPDVERALGAALRPLAARVDLESPEVTIGVEVVDDRAYLFSRRIEGAAGLPAGVEGRALCLVSGGFDSAVAAWRMMRRGVAVDFLFCNLGGIAHERMVLQVVKVLDEVWGAGARPRFNAVDFTAPVADLKRKVKPRYWQLLLKRLMYRAGDRVARETGAEALITGESLGQVSSQTLSNLAAIDSASARPVLRPLIGADKVEIVAEARRIGTAPLSERIKELCAIAEGSPVISCEPGRAEALERGLDLSLVEAAVAARRRFDVRAVTATDLRAPYLFTEEIPRDAVVIDCQPESLFEAWHVAGARHADPQALIDRSERLSRDERYVLYCTYGTQTPLLAEILQQRGVEAYAFKGGIAAVKRYVEARERR